MFSAIVQGLIMGCGARVMGYADAMREGKNIGFIAFMSGGFFDPVNDFVAINESFLDSHLDYVVLHELVHWSGHSSRLARQSMVNSETPEGRLHISPNDYETEEMTAQWGMYFLAVHLGFDENATALERDRYNVHFVNADQEKAKQDGLTAANYLLAMLNQAQAA